MYDSCIYFHEKDKKCAFTTFICTVVRGRSNRKICVRDWTRFKRSKILYSYELWLSIFYTWIVICRFFTSVERCIDHFNCCCCGHNFITTIFAIELLHLFMSSFFLFSLIRMHYVGQYRIQELDKVMFTLNKQFGKIAKVGGLIGHPDLLFVFDGDEIRNIFKKEEILPHRCCTVYTMNFANWSNSNQFNSWAISNQIYFLCFILFE